MEGGGPPLGDAVVEIWTDEPEIDFPDAAHLAPRRGEIRHRARLLQRREWLAETQGRRPTLWAQAEEDGSFEVPVPHDLGWFRVAVDAEYAHAEERPRLLFGTPPVEAGLTIVLEPAGKVEGTVHLPSPLGGRRGFVQLEQGGDDPPTVRIDDGGRFEVRGLRPGLYSAGAFVEGFAPAEVRGIEVREGEAIRLDFKPTPESSVAGEVVDEEGKGVPSARIEVTSVEVGVSPPPPFGAGKTDSQGAFRIGSLAAGENHFRIEDPGFVYSFLEIHLAAGERKEGVRIVLRAGHSIAGRVLGPGGEGVSGATLTANADDEAWRRNRPGEDPPWSRQEAESGPGGSFRIGGLAEGYFGVFAFHPDFGAGAANGLETGREDLEIVLSGLGAVAGRVRDARTGEPVRRFRMGVKEFMSTGASSVSSEVFWARWFESEDGTFERTDLQHGEYRFLFEARGYVAHITEDVEVKSGARVEGLEIALERAVTIRGRVIERASGLPVVGAEVRWIRGDPEAPIDDRESLVVTAPDGSFELADAETGTGRCVARHPKFLLAASELLELRAEENLEGVVVALERGGSIEGVARRPDGTPYTGADAGASGVSLDCDGEAEVCPDGSFLIEGLRPGRYVVRVDPPQDWDFSDSEHSDSTLTAVAVVEGGRTTRVDFDAAEKSVCRVRGRVFRGESPAPGASIVLLPAGADRDPELSALYAGRFHKWADEEGRYEFRGVPPGEAVLRANVSGTGLEVPLRVPDTPELEFDVRFPSGAIEGRVVREPEGSPIPSVWVMLRNAEESEDRSRPKSGGAVTTDKEGRFRFEGLLPGEYSLRATPDRRRTPGDPIAPATFGPFSVTHAQTTRVDLTLQAGGRATVLVSDPDGKPVAGASVRLLQSEESEKLLPQSTGADGFARLEGLAPGRYVAGVSGVSFGVPPSEVREVVPGGEVSFRIDLTPGVRVHVRLDCESGREIGYPQAVFADAQGRRFEARFPRGSWVAPSSSAFGALVLHPGEYTLTARAAGHAEKTAIATVGGPASQEIALSLEEVASRK
jgi:protocatechuate 3,4-dioxygenase beta subunit